MKPWMKDWLGLSVGALIGAIVGILLMLYSGEVESCEHVEIVLPGGQVVEGTIEGTCKRVRLPEPTEAQIDKWATQAVQQRRIIDGMKAELDALVERSRRRAQWP